MYTLTSNLQSTKGFRPPDGTIVLEEEAEGQCHTTTSNLLV